MSLQVSQLDAQSQAFIANLQHQTSVLPKVVSESIANAAKASQKPLTLEQVVQAVEGALPKCRTAAAIQKALGGAKQAALSHHCDNDNPKFLTQIFSLRIEKEVNEVVSQPTIRRTARDPLYASFNMAPDADFMLLFNARDVDRNGRPLLMKIVAREGCDPKKLDLSGYRTKEGWKRDVVTVPVNADVVNIKDVHEDEFELGDPLKQVSLGSKGQELSTSVEITRDNTLIRHYYRGRNGQPWLAGGKVRASTTAKGEGVDSTHVARFMDRIQLHAEPKKDVVAPWLDAASDQFNLSLHVDRGFMFEPNSAARITYAGKSISTGVAIDDAQLLGSPAGSVALDPNHTRVKGRTLKYLLQRGVNVRTSTRLKAGGEKNDIQATGNALWQAIYAEAKNVTIGGKVMTPLADKAFARGGLKAAGMTIVKRPVKDDDFDGQVAKVSLDAGFIRSKDAASVDGWKIAVGYMKAGKWVDCGRKTIDGDCSAAMNFDVQLPDTDTLHAAKTKLEMRVYNKHGVPAERVLVAMDQIDWDPALRS